ncbi:MAG: WecB/TagA/CpsF family glycosyltransferase [Phycisphaerales bacterium]|nr:WecB/TagA/CpsF family glycosyltransferase [Phycisphaerales bacterium]
MMNLLPTIQLRGAKLHAVTEAQCIGHILDELDAARGGVVITPNLDHLHRLERDASFAALYQHADLIIADGMPLVWASRLQGTPLPQRVAGSTLFIHLSKAAAQRNRTIFLLGGAPSTADRAAAILQGRFPGLTIAGTCCPPMGFERDPATMEKIKSHLLVSRPDIVYVGLGSPKQERLIEQLKNLLPRAWWLGVGISFSFLCGEVRRAPRWMQRCGLEWTHRLWQEPGRLAKRYLIDDLPFALRLFTGAYWNRLTYNRERKDG